MRLLPDVWLLSSNVVVGQLKLSVSIAVVSLCMG